ncbi:glycoside hydrolase family 2, partial [Alkalihalophilus lindianensis]|nr:glycoside hydrolase family 2 [Alkalihalophilus lindianensis]
PNLYDIKFELFQEGNSVDLVNSYFGMRKISIEGRKILLNNRDLYQRLILDQGYWKESDLTPPSVEALETDIDKVLEMGYNGVRKHQ